jgi:hypothetical protein
LYYLWNPYSLKRIPEAVFLVVPMESLLVEDDVMSRQAGIKA